MDTITDAAQRPDGDAHLLHLRRAAQDRCAADDARASVSQSSQAGSRVDHSIVCLWRCVSPSLLSAREQEMKSQHIPRQQAAVTTHHASHSLSRTAIEQRIAASASRHSLLSSTPTVQVACPPPQLLHSCSPYCGSVCVRKDLYIAIAASGSYLQGEETGHSTSASGQHVQRHHSVARTAVCIAADSGTKCPECLILQQAEGHHSSRGSRRDGQ